jgi:hypothetical protein
MKNPYFYHGTTSDGRRFTIAGKFVKKGLISPKESLIMGVSICGKKDNFIKKVGRIKSEGRLHATNEKGNLEVPVKLVGDFEVREFIGQVTKFNTYEFKNLVKAFHLYHDRV